MKSNELKKRILTSIILLPVIIFIILSSKIFFVGLLVCVFFISFFEWFFLNNNKISISTILGIFILFFSMLSAYFLFGKSLQEQVILLWIVLICFFSDIGGLFFGKIFKGKKLTKISPNKTYAGSIGSFLFAFIPILFFDFFNNTFFFKNNFLVLSNITLILTLLFSFTCQVGDIIISYFKRLNNVKDTGFLLPGHGGLLDRIDGIIFVLIIFEILKSFNIFS